MKALAHILFGIIVGATLTVSGQKAARSDPSTGTVRRVPPDQVPAPMRPFLTEASEITLGQYLVVHGGPQSHEVLGVFFRNDFPVLIAESTGGKSFTMSVQDRRGLVCSVRDKNGDGGMDSYDVSIVSGDKRITHMDTTLDGVWDFQLEEKLDGENWTKVETRIRYKDGWLPYVVIDGKPAVKTKDGIRRIEVKNGEVELQ